MRYLRRQCVGQLHTWLASQDIFFVGIDSPSAIKEFALQCPVSYLLLIGGSEGREAMKAIGNRNASLPYTLDIDPSCAPAFAKLGMIEDASFEAQLLQIIAATKR